MIYSVIIRPASVMDRYLETLNGHKILICQNLLQYDNNDRTHHNHQNSIYIYIYQRSRLTKYMLLTFH